MTTWYSMVQQFLFHPHCVKSVQIRSFFWSVFSRIRTEYGEILRISPYSVRVRENTDQKKLGIWTLFTQCHQYLGQCDSCSLDEQNVPLISHYLLANYKKNLTTRKNHAYLILGSQWRHNLAYSIYHRVDIYKLVKRLTFSFC